MSIVAHQTGIFSGEHDGGFRCGSEKHSESVSRAAQANNRKEGEPPAHSIITVANDQPSLR